jgi:hypothetical protein
LDLYAVIADRIGFKYDLNCNFYDLAVSKDDLADDLVERIDHVCNLYAQKQMSLLTVLAVMPGNHNRANLKLIWICFFVIAIIIFTTDEFTCVSLVSIRIIPKQIFSCITDFIYQLLQVDIGFIAK